jgi:hypothetical protein
MRSCDSEKKFAVNQTNDSAASITNHHKLTVSSDGYVRISTSALANLRFTHFLSGLDGNTIERNYEGGYHAYISGYTEWLTNTAPVVTLGWDWYVDSIDQEKYIRKGPPRTNLMFVNDMTHHDLGDIHTGVLLGEYIDLLDWQAELHKHMTTRFYK